MRYLLPALALLIMATPLAAQDTKKTDKAPDSKPGAESDRKDDKKADRREERRADRKSDKKDDGKADSKDEKMADKKESDKPSEKPSDKATEADKRAAAAVRLPNMPDLNNPRPLKEMVSAATNSANKDVDALGLKGKTAKTYREAMISLAEEEHALQESAVKRRDEVLAEMAKELAKLTGKPIREVTRRQYLLLYGAAMMRPEQYRPLREDRYEQQNAFTALVTETGKPFDDVKATATTIRAMIAEDNPWSIYRNIQESRSAFNGTIKNLFTPEQYFEYLKVKGLDKAPKNAEVDSRYLRALREIEMTESQKTRIRDVLKEKEMDDEIKREKVNDILSDAQKKQLEDALKPKDKRSE